MSKHTNRTGDESPHFMNVRQVAELLGVSDRTIYQAIKTQGLPAIRVRRYWRIPSAKFDVWVERQLDDGLALSSYPSQHERGA